jgi:hypothetical protein
VVPTSLQPHLLPYFISTKQQPSSKCVSAHNPRGSTTTVRSIRLSARCTVITITITTTHAPAILHRASARAATDGADPSSIKRGQAGRDTTKPAKLQQTKPAGMQLEEISIEICDEKGNSHPVPQLISHLHKRTPRYGQDQRLLSFPSRTFLLSFPFGRLAAHRFTFLPFIIL